jgi:hypothetical protein
VIAATTRLSEMPNINLPYKFKPRKYQEPLWDAILDPKFKRGVAVIPRRNGKDLVCWNACIAKAMQRKGLYFYMAPYYNQVRQIIWEGSDGAGRKFLDYIPRELIKTKTKLDMRIELVNGSQIKLNGSDNIDSIMGTNPVGVVFTEFSLHKPESWDYIRPILAENGGWAIFNGTPRGLNHLYKLFEDARRDPSWFCQYLTRDDTEIPTLEAIEQDRRSGMPDSLIQQEYYCSWVSSQEETLIPLDVIAPTINRNIDYDDYSFHHKIVGVDPAYAVKGDHACIARRQGALLHPIEKMQGVDNMSLATRVAQVIDSWSADFCMIDAGRGEGVISRLDQLGYGRFVIPVHFSGRPFSELYLNKRAEIWCRMRNWFIAETKPSIPDDDKLHHALSTPLFFTNDKGYVQLESKAQMRTRLSGRVRMDEADAVAVTFAEEFSGEPTRAQMEMRPEIAVLSNLMGRPTEAISDYDPLNYFNAL